MQTATKTASPTASPTPAADCAAEVLGSTPLRVWGLTSNERIQRQLARAGVASAHATRPSRGLLLRADWVYDDALVKALAAAGTDTALVCDDEVVGLNVQAALLDESRALLPSGRAPQACRRLGAAELADAYNNVLRKREPPYLMHLTAESLPAVERRVFGGAYKGVTDLVTLYVWPRPARHVTKLCANAGITPNQVTSASLVLVFAAMACFWTGHHVWGLLAAWPMTFLDTVDGKLARVTLRSTKFGDVFDHAIDLVHPPFWWWAWIVGLPAAGIPVDNASLILWTIVGGYVLQRIEEGIFIASFGMDMHVWQRFDSRFRLITARRNPNLVLLTAAVLAGRPDLGIIAVAVWTAASLLVHLLRIVQAALARRRGPLRSWLAARA